MKTTPNRYARAAMTAKYLSCLPKTTVYNGTAYYLKIVHSYENTIHAGYFRHGETLIHAQRPKGHLCEVLEDVYDQYCKINQIKQS